MIEFTLNGKRVSVECAPDKVLREVLYEDFHLNSVRDSDDREGFAGSDVVIFNDAPRPSNLILAIQAENADIRTPESLLDGRKLNDVQQALVEAGVVQSAYNSPTTALILTWLLEKKPDATRADVKEVMSSVFIRDASYEHYYKAVEAVKERRAKGISTVMMAPEFREDLKVIGKNTGKIDGPALVSGQPMFVEDKVVDGAYSLKVMRSPFASAYIDEIDTAKAEALDGVVKVFTYKNTPDVYYTTAGQGYPEPSPHDKKLFNQKLRHFGDRVAAVVAVDEETCKKAISLISVRYTPLKPVINVVDAAAAGAPLVHNGKVSYAVGAPADLDEYNRSADPRDGEVIYMFPLHGDIHKNIAAGARGGIGDMDKGFAEADEIVDEIYETDQIQCTPLEPHVCYTLIENDRLVLHCSTQVPWHVRRIVSTICGVSENKVHVIKERVGGGYGSKQDILVEDLCGYATFVTGKPIYYRNTREEEFIANSTRHPMRINVKMGGKKDGTITAIYMNIMANTGCWGNHCLTVPMNAASKTLPMFKVANMYYDLNTYYTNCCPAGAYQGYGAPKGAFAISMALGELAKKLGVSLVDMLEKNAVDEGYMLDILKGLGEGREGAIVPVGSCGLKEAVRMGAEMIDFDHREVSDDPAWKIGKGVAMIQQGSGLPGLDQANSQVKLLTDGTALVLSGGADLGTGLDTICAKIVSEELGLPLDKISVVSGDTDSCLFDTGAYASSGTYFSGNATLNATRDLKKKMLEEASYQMGEKVEDLSLIAPGLVVSAASGKTLDYWNLAHTASGGTGHGSLIGTGCFVTNNAAVPYGAHFAQVAVNTDTGEIKVQKFYAIQDAGTPINPEVALCQMYGAALKSIGHTLYEGMIYDKEGRVVNANLTDYGTPMIGEMPEDFKAVLLPVVDDYGPFGAKSISEIATNGAAGAIGNAIADAVGVFVKTWPITPEKILRELKKF
jgi:probable selenate reductase, molybdenum-binding subunit